MNHRSILKSLYWGVYGRTIRNPAMPSRTRSMLFVCLGNICRSPFAEEIARRKCRSSNALEFDSAGLRVESPRFPPKEAIEVARNFGVNLESHRSRPLKYDLIESYDMIVGMEAWHVRFMRNLFMEYQEKIFLLPVFEHRAKRFSDPYSIYNIQDPYNRDISDFEKCFERIEKSLDGFFQHLK